MEREREKKTIKPKAEEESLSGGERFTLGIFLLGKCIIRGREAQARGVNTSPRQF